jgi:hypothetical protein
MRYSLLHLVGMMAFVAIGLGALASASSVLASSFLTATILALCAGIVAAALTSGESRAYWLAFTVFAGVHLVLTLAPWLDDRTGEFLLSRRALDALGAAMGYEVADHQSMPGIWPNLPYAHSKIPSYHYLNFVVIGQCWISLGIGWLAGIAASAFVQRRGNGRR